MIHRIKAFIQVLKESRHPVKMLLAQILAKTGLNRFFKIQMNGYKIRFSKSALAITFFANSAERHDDEDFLKRVLKPGEVYADVGANIGTLVLSASTLVGSNGKVIGIEPHPATFKYLQANVDLNGFKNISIINAAVGNKKGRVSFSNINSDDQNKVLLQDKAGIEVKLDTLDDLLDAVNIIHVLKIDVEGYEKYVMEGATACLQKTNIVLYESWEKHFSEFGYTTSDVISILQQNRFAVYKINQDTLELLSASYRSMHCENLVAVKDIKAFCLQYNYTTKL